MWLLLIFVILPIIEIALFIKVGGLIGFWPTMAMVIAAAVAGSWLMRRQGAAALTDLQRSFLELRDPTAPLAHGALILLAGALMVTPGFFSDILGIALLFPVVRRLVIRQLAARLTATRVGFGVPPGRPGSRGGDPRRGTVIDADFVVIHPDEPKPEPPDADTPPPSGGPAGRPTGRPSGWTRH